MSRYYDSFHAWINRRQNERRQADPQAPFEHDLYEWLRALQETQRLPHGLRQARTNTLPTVHRQCSNSPEEPIHVNRLLCALGKDVTECPILRSVYEHALSGPWRVEEDEADKMAAQVCTWHIFTESQRRSVDTSEGYVQDESDRMFWSTVYDHLSSTSPEEVQP